LRLLWNRVLEASGAKPTQPVKLHVETGWRMMAARDPETNILRNTIALSAAALGGADSISVLPHTIANGLPDAAARRISRMMQLIARDESHLGQVMDVAAGSGSIEALTDAVCEASWAQFQELEQAGGPLKALASGSFQAGVADARLQRQAGMEHTKLIGVNAFLLKDMPKFSVLEHPAAAAEFPSKAMCEPLPLWSVENISKAST
jgi:methylmalonyl-CoA mutase